MAVSLLVANSKPAKRLGRLSRRRADPRPEPSPAKEAEVKEVRLKAAKETVKLLLWTEIEEWQQHGSDHIQTGYRRATGSVAGCLRSWTFLHNETVNIYSHVVGALAFLTLLPAYHLIFPAAATAPVTAPALRRWEVATAGDLLACGTYLAGVAACFVLSAAFHTLMAHSEALYLAGMKLDLQGVLLLMWGATVPLVRYTFPCDDGGADTRMRWAYGVGLAGLAGLCSAATFLPRFSGPRMGPWRAVLFGVFGAASFALPIAHGAVRYGLGEMAERTGLGWVGATVMWNGLGVGVYGMKFPERWCPRRFDLFGASHQLMHICVVVAALTYTCAVVQMFDYHHNQETNC